MDIDIAVKMLESAEGKVLNCSTQEKVKSITLEDFWFVLVESEYEDGTLDRMQLPMERFKKLYARQHFVETGPIEPLVDEKTTHSDTEVAATA